MNHRLALCLGFLVLPCLAAAAREAPAEDRFSLVDDFADQDLLSTDYGAWIALDDRKDGGSSSSDACIEEAGPEASACARFTFALGAPFRKEGKPQAPRAFLALLLGEKLGASRDLTEFEGLRFQARAGETLSALLVVIAQGAEGPEYWSTRVPLETEWSWVEIPFSRLEPIVPGTTYTEALQPTAVQLIALGSGLGDVPATAGTFWVDDFGFLVKSQETRRREALDLADHRYLDMVISAPRQSWVFDGQKLKAPGKGCEISFASYLIDGDRRVPFGRGLSADPGNVKDLARCFLALVQTMGVVDVQEEKPETFKIGRKRAHRFAYTGQLTPKLAQTAPLLVGGARVEVVFLKEGGRTYQITAVLPVKRQQELVPEVRRIIGTFRPAD